MNIAAWTLQTLLAVVFLLHGVLYVVPPRSLLERMAREGVRLPEPPGFRRFIGVAELLAAAGLVLPGITGIYTWLTPLAAAGLMVVMGGAVVFHLSRRQAQHAPRETWSALFAAVLLALLTFVAYVRWQILPLA